MGLNCKCPTFLPVDQTREFTTIVLGIFTISDTAHQSASSIRDTRAAPSCVHASRYSRVQHSCTSA